MKKGLMKVVALAAASVMAVAALAGCGSSDKLIMGTNAAFPPFEYTTSQGLVGEFDGIDVAIANKIAENVGKELQIEDMEFDGLVASVSTGKVDMVVAGMTATDEKKQSVDFSDPYYVASQVIVVAPDNTDITSAEDLKNDKTVGVVLGYTGDNIVTNDLQLAEDSATGKALAEKNGLKIVEDPQAFETEEYAIAVKKGNTELLDKINETLSEMKASGEIEQLAMEYDEKLAENNQ